MKINKLLLYFNLFFLQSYLVRFKIGNFPTNLQEVLIGLQCLVFLFAIIKNKTFLQTIKNLKRHWVILGLLGLTLLSTALVPTENKIDFLRHSRFLIISCVTSFIFIETFKTSEERFKAFKIAGIGAMVFGFFCVAYNLLGYNVAYDHRLLGPLDAAVYLGYYLTPFFIFFAIEFFKDTKVKSNLLYAIALGILMLATVSMGSLTGSLIVILLYLFKKNDSKILKSKTARAIIGAICLLVSATVFYLKILPTIQTNYSSISEREQIWTTSFSLLKTPKNLALGVGFGQFQEQYAQHVKAVLGHEPLDYYVLQPHNIFLLFIFQFGILGFTFLLFCINRNLHNIFSWKKDQPFDFRILANFLLLYFFIHGLIDTPFFKNDLLIILVLLMELSLLKTSNKTLEN
ncbi:MAG: O-antigen ligase family protein [Candidatus Peregrinibacteria bacterium]|nr:O-antigen ligase family protein [Candidatus Peregrinibacteria bacterium]